MDDVLSQDEVDSLFGDDPPEAPAAEPASAAETVRDYDLANQERIVRGRMPTLEIINERFARNFRNGLFNFLRRTPEFTVTPVRVLKYSAFLRDLVLPTNLNIVQMKTLRGSSLFIFEPTLIFGIVEMMFGGNGRVQTRIEGREFTDTELRIIQKMLDMVLTDYSAAWAPIFNLKLEYLRSEMQPHFASIATPSEVVVVSKIEIEIGHVQGALHICMPYSSLEPIRDVLVSTTQGDSGEPDNRWVGLLSKQMQTAEVELVATLATRRATLRQILDMRPGDVVPLQIKELIEAHVDGVPLFEGRPGTHNNRYALRVENVLAHPDELKPISR